MSHAELPPELKTIPDLPRSERVSKLFGFDPTDYQAELLDYHEQQSKTQAAPKKGRQVGATLSGSAIAADRAISTPNGETLITAPKKDPANELFEEFKNHFRNPGSIEVNGKDYELSQEALGVAEANKTEWRFNNGHRVLCRTLGQGELSQRSLNPSCVIVDEAQSASDYHLSEVVEPFFITHNEYEFYLLGTPRGKSGYFYNAVEGSNSDEWFSPHWPTKISPFADEDYLEQKRREKDSTTYAQEYEGEFADTGQVWIDTDLFKSCVEPTIDAEPELTYLGVDIARKGEDRTVYLHIGASGTVHNIWAEETSTVPGIVGRIKNLHERHGFEQVYVDENAVGGGVVDSHDLQNLVTGITFSSKSKHQMYTNLKTAFESNSLTIPSDLDYYAELERETTQLDFEFTSNNYLKVSHPENEHDDFADALALANMAREGINTTTVKRRNARATMHKGQ